MLVRLADVHLTLRSDAGPVHILRGVDLEIAPGEAVAVVGPSGSGKSTLLAVTAGLEQPTSGTIDVAGHALGGMDEDALALFRRDHVGIVFQSFHLIPTMTALENVAVPRELAGRGDAFARATALLEQVGLDHRLGHYPAQLSGGEQQRVALARAFVNDPPLLLADEPTGNLDADTGRAVIDAMFAVRAAVPATTLVLITHEERLAGRCERTVRMRDGRVVDEPGAAAGPVRVAGTS